MDESEYKCPICGENPMLKEAKNLAIERLKNSGLDYSVRSQPCSGFSLEIIFQNNDTVSQDGYCNQCDAKSLNEYLDRK